MQNSILNPVKKEHLTGDYTHAEVTLANRNCGTILETLHHDVTPLGAHYLLNHFDVPFVENDSDWKLDIEGTVQQPLSIDLAELKKRAAISGKAKTIRVTLECAGNGRSNVSPRWPSQPWQFEAVGTADWYGLPLSALLDEITLNADSHDVVFHGADQGIDGGTVHHFARSLSVANAWHDDVLLAWQMNGQPLLPQHGFPLRLIVPGWYGMASVKWLNKIEVIDHAFDGHQQTGAYIYRQSDDDPGTPVTTIRVQSLMVPPGIPDWSTRSRLIKPGPIALCGRAWSGSGTPIEKVEWACDGKWQEAGLQPSDHPYAWSKWTAQWQATRGEHLLSCRATDKNGEVQPITPVWDNAGFGNNAAQTVEVCCDDF